MNTTKILFNGVIELKPRVLFSRLIELFIIQESIQKVLIYTNWAIRSIDKLHIGRLIIIE